MGKILHQHYGTLAISQKLLGDDVTATAIETFAPEADMPIAVMLDEGGFTVRTLNEDMLRPASWHMLLKSLSGQEAAPGELQKINFLNAAAADRRDVEAHNAAAERQQQRLAEEIAAEAKTDALVRAGTPEGKIPPRRRGFFGGR